MFLQFQVLLGGSPPSRILEGECNHLGRAHSALTQRIDVLHLFISHTLISLVWMISRWSLLIVDRCDSYIMAG